MSQYHSNCSWLLNVFFSFYYYPKRFLMLQIHLERILNHLYDGKKSLLIFFRRFNHFWEVSRVLKENMIYVWEQLIKIPALAMIYNGCMGWTDSFDQFLTYFRTIVMTKRWQTRIFTHFLMAAVVNSHIWFKLGGGKKLKPGGLKISDAGFTLLEFTHLLVDELCQTSTNESIIAKNVPTATREYIHHSIVDNLKVLLTQYVDDKYATRWHKVNVKIMVKLYA